MRIAIYGATGMVGTDIDIEAMKRGHQVTPISRRGGRGTYALHLEDTEAFLRVADHHDVVVIAVPPPRGGGSHDPFLGAIDRIVHSGTRTRLIFVGGSGSLRVRGVPVNAGRDFPPQLLPESITMAAVLEKLRNAPPELDWTMISPSPSIEPGPPTGSYRLSKETPAGPWVSTRDFAVALLDEIERPKHRRERFTVASVMHDGDTASVAAASTS